MTWTIEEPTRFAQLLAGETHLTEINKDLGDFLERLYCDRVRLLR
jgi:hypothetical protein